MWVGIAEPSQPLIHYASDRLISLAKFPVSRYGWGVAPVTESNTPFAGTIGTSGADVAAAIIEDRDGAQKEASVNSVGLDATWIWRSVDQLHPS